jgi:hypothetical protein
VILFLDFDGVLHPQYEGEPTPVGEVFCHLPRFESIMRDFPFVEIVISSTWRDQFSLDVLRSKFSPDIAARIIGVTPTIDLTDGVCRQSARENEILGWLGLNQKLDAAWVALDDTAWQFNKFRDHLVACTWYVGMNEDVELKLRARLAER